MKSKILVIFGILDLILIFRFGHYAVTNFFYVFKYIGKSSAFPLLLEATTRFLFFISLIFSSIFLIIQKRIGCIISYAQFPFRMAFLSLSFGFLAHLNVFFHNQSFYFGIICFCIILEIGRLIVTIVIHRNMLREG